MRSSSLEGVWLSLHPFRHCPFWRPWPSFALSRVFLVHCERTSRVWLNPLSSWCCVVLTAPGQTPAQWQERVPVISHHKLRNDHCYSVNPSLCSRPPRSTSHGPSRITPVFARGPSCAGIIPIAWLSPLLLKVRTAPVAPVPLTLCCPAPLAQGCLCSLRQGCSKLRRFQSFSNLLETQKHVSDLPMTWITISQLVTAFPFHLDSVTFVYVWEF